MKKQTLFQTVIGICCVLFLMNGNAAALNVSGVISTNTPWTLANSPYVVTGTVTVNAGVTLTVEPGVVVKFNANTYLTVNGTLTADGTADKKIYFTSVKDDTIGGDTNGDGTATVPAPGNWGGLTFNTGAANNVLDYAVVRYGGSGAWSGSVKISTSSLTLSNSVVENSTYNGIFIDGVSPTVTGCTIQNNGYTVSESGIYANNSKGVFTGNTIKDNGGYGMEMPNSVNATLENNTLSGNKYNAALIGGTLDADRTFQGGITYLISSLTTVPQGMKLTVEPGVVVKFNSGIYLTVNGTLTADGTADKKIYFTSFKDDTVGGDTNGDGTATVPAHGDWGFLDFTATSTGSVLDYAVLRYSGATSGSLKISTSSLTVSNSVIENSKNYGIWIYQVSPTVTGCTVQNNGQITGKSGIYAYLSKGVFTGNTIKDNGGYGMEMTSSVNATIENNTLSGNKYNAAMISGTLDADRTWRSGMIYVSQYTTVPQGMKLTVEPGTIVKFDGSLYNAMIKVDGTLTADGTSDKKIYFTSFKDDTVGGDTNGDGTATVPAPGDWGNLQFTATSTGNLLDYAVVRCTRSTYGSLEIRTSSLTVSNSLIENSNAYGIWTYDASPTVTGCTIQNNGKSGIYANDSKGVFTDNTIKDNGGYGIELVATSETTSADSLVKNNTLSGNKYNAIYVSGGITTDVTWYSDQIYVVTAVSVHESAKLTIEPGTIVKMLGGYNSRLSVAGTLTAKGTADKKIYFTAFTDDSVGGDTNGDGDATVPAPGYWEGMQFSSQSINNVLDYVVFRYGSRRDYDGRILDIYTSSLTVTNSLFEYAENGLWITNASPVIAGNMIRNCSEYALYLTNQSNPILYFNAFVNNSNGVRNISNFFVNGKYNYWGSSGEPGSDLVGTNLAYDPWLDYNPYEFAQERTATPLTLGTPHSGTVNSHTIQDFSVQADAGKSLLIEMVPNTGINAIYMDGKFGELPLYPTTGEYSSESLSVRGAYELLISPSREGTYYFSLFGLDVNDGGGTYTITARYVNRHISDISPQKGFSGGNAILIVKGLGFAEGTNAGLKKSGTATRMASEVQIYSPELTAVFPLNNMPLGIYDVVIFWQDGTQEVFEGIYEIKEGTPPRIEAYIQMSNPLLRMNRVYTAWLTYQNVGETHVPAPLFTVESDKCLLSLERNEITDSSVQVLGIGTSTTPGVLRAGEHRRIPVYFKTSTLSESVEFNLLITHDTIDGIDWNTEKAKMKPADMSDTEWNTLFPKLTARLGSTWSDYTEILRQDANRFRHRGIEQYDVSAFIRFEARQAEGKPVAAVSGILLDADTGLPMKDVSLKIVSSDKSVLKQVKTAADPEGRFVFENLPDGEYEIFAEGWYFDESVLATVSGGEDENGLICYGKKVPDEKEQETAKIPDFNPAAAVDSAGNLAAVWQRGREIWWTVNRGTGWNQSGKISGALGFNPVLVYDTYLVNGTSPGFLVSWESETAPRKIMWAAGQINDQGMAWSEPQSLTSDANPDFGIAVAVDSASHKPVFLWLQRDFSVRDDSDLYYKVTNIAVPISGRSDDGENLGSAREKVCEGITYPKNETGLKIPKWVPMIGGNYGLFIKGEICGENGCTRGLSGSVGAEVQIGEIGTIGGSASGSAKWVAGVEEIPPFYIFGKSTPGECKYIFDEANFSVGVSGELRVTSPPQPLLVYGVPIGYFTVGALVSVDANGTLVWKSNFPGWPTNGILDTTFTAGPTGFLSLIGGYLAETDVAGTLSGTFEINAKPYSAEFKGYCLALEGTYLICSWWEDDWRVEWGTACPEDRRRSFGSAHSATEPRIVSERDRFARSRCRVRDGVQICEEGVKVKKELIGTGNIYEGTPVLANISNDLKNDGMPSAARSSTGQTAVVWTKDMSKAELGSNVYISMYQGTSWSVPVQISPSPEFSKDAAVVFDSDNNIIAAWSQALNDGLNFDTSTVEELVNASEKSEIVFSVNTGGTWSSPQYLAVFPGKDEMVSLAAGPGGEVTAVWVNSQDDVVSVYASIWNGSYWSGPSVLSATVLADPPAAVYSKTGQPTVVWAEDTDGDMETFDDRDIFSSFWNGVTWSMPALVYSEESQQRKAVRRSSREGSLSKPPEECCPQEEEEQKEDEAETPPDTANIPNSKSIGSATASTVHSLDPNEKAGNAGVGTAHYILAGDWLHYIVYFENKSTATAPAQEVFITDCLSEHLDWSTLRVEEAAFGDTTLVNPKESGSFTARATIADYRGTEKEWWAEVHTEMNAGQAGCLKVVLRTLDPETGDLPEDALAGLLPPENGTGRGQGHISFSVQARSDLAAGTVIKNSATIIFDTEQPIVTNEYANTVTNAAPSAAAEPGISSGAVNVSLPAVLSWTEPNYATSYDLYLWKDGSAKPSVPTVQDLQTPSYDTVFSLNYDTKYRWQVIARNVMGESAGPEWTFTTGSYPNYLRDAIYLLKMMTGIPAEDTAYINDLGYDGIWGMGEVVYNLQKAAKLR